MREVFASTLNAHSHTLETLQRKKGCPEEQPLPNTVFLFPSSLVPSFPAFYAGEGEPSG